VIERTIEIVNSLGLHARPAAQFVRLAAGFDSEIELARDEMSVNGKSIMGVMMLAAECGSQVVVRASGSDEEEAISALEGLIRNGFGET
jgi:phosphocarrier protein